jgi:hypothetical protein
MIAKDLSGVHLIGVPIGDLVSAIPLESTNAPKNNEPGGLFMLILT